MINEILLDTEIYEKENIDIAMKEFSEACKLETFKQDHYIKINVKENYTTYENDIILKSFENYIIGISGRNGF